MKKIIILSLSLANLRSARWEISRYVWTYGIICNCDYGIDRDPKNYFLNQDEEPFQEKYYKDIKPYSKVWVKYKHIKDFYDKILKNNISPIILIISGSDNTFPNDCEKNFDPDLVINHPSVIHIFAQNNKFGESHKKITSIPIGMDYHTIAYRGDNGGWGEKGAVSDQENCLIDIINSSLPITKRKKRIYTDFQLNDTAYAEFQRYIEFGEDRRQIFEKIKKTGLVDYSLNFQKRYDLWRNKSQYAFSVSPHGNGLDCHRTWEDLILGCIVIVKSSPLDNLYQNLPVVIVNDWDEINEENLDKWLSINKDKFQSAAYKEIISNNYWIEKINSLLTKKQPNE
jgi:hypothetical protein